jgi:hypothetical protein
MAFFSDRQPFLLEPLGKTSGDAARAQEKLLMWAVKESDFKEEIRLCIKQWLLYGFTAARWGWKTVTKSKKSYQRVEAEGGNPARVKKTEEPYDISHPTFEHIELRAVLFDPSLRQPDGRKAKWVCAQLFTNGYGLEELRSDATYKNIPTRAQLAEILARKDEPTVDSLQGSKQITNRDLQALPQTQQATVDPLSQDLELLEYECEDRIITILQRQIVIRNSENEFGKKTFLSAAFIDVPGAMYGFGVAKLLSGDQRFQIGVTNKWVDQLSIQLNPAFHVKKGVGPGVQNVKLSPGKIINEAGEMTPLTTTSVTTEALQAISASELRATRRVGANGSDNMPTQALRTAEGVNTFNQGIVDKLQYAIENFADMIFIPALEAFLTVCKDKLQPEDIKNILSEEDGKAYQGDILDVYNGQCRVQVLSSTKLAARRAAAQLLPILLQFMQNAPVQDALTAQGQKVDYTEFLKEALDLAGWDVAKIIVPASPEEIQRAMMMKPGVAQAQAQQAIEVQKHQDDLENIEAQGMAKAGVKVVDHVLKQSSEDSGAVEPKSPFGT